MLTAVQRASKKPRIPMYLKEIILTTADQRVYTNMQKIYRLAGSKMNISSNEYQAAWIFGV